MFFWMASKGSRQQERFDAFQDGVTARSAGKRLADNPFCLSSGAHKEWAEGWRATLDLDEDDDMESCRDRSNREIDG
jgi:hypothetical protein